MSTGWFWKIQDRSSNNKPGQSKKVEMEQGIQEMDVNQDNQNKLEEQSIEAQHVKTKNCL